MTDEPLPLELAEPEPVITCWYCGREAGALRA
jgi:hypothetical protein